MKKLAAIGLLLLLLYNTFGAAIAILLFDNHYQTSAEIVSHDKLQTLKVYVPSLPYSDDTETEDGLGGLIKTGDEFYNAIHALHSNDTLYVTLEANTAARDRFFELADMMEKITDFKSDGRTDTTGKCLHLLSDLFKIYLSTSQQTFTAQVTDFNIQQQATYPALQQGCNSDRVLLNTPPPEHC